MARRDAVGITKVILGGLSYNIGAIAIVSSFLFALVPGLRPISPVRAVVVLTVGLCLIAAGYTFTFNEAKPEYRHALLANHLLLIPLLLSILLLGRGGLVLFKLLPEDRVMTWTSETGMALFGCMLAVVTIFGYRIFRRRLKPTKKTRPSS